MRDIRSDLRERLDKAEAGRRQIVEAYEAKRRALDEEFKQSVATLEAEVAALRSLLNIETQRHGGVAQPAVTPAVPLSDFLLKAIREGGPKTKDELRDIAAEAGYFREGESPGRVVHGYVLSHTKAGRLVVDANKRLRIPGGVAGGSEKMSPANVARLAMF